MSIQYPQQAEQLATPEQVVPAKWVRFLRRVMALPPGHAYALTLWVPEDGQSEPVWSVSNLGKIENQR